MLHREIYWLGRQWCVTGYGIQATNARYRRAFDIPADRIWEDHLDQAMVGEDWFDAADFAEAVRQARLRADAAPSSFLPVPGNEK